ncbi:MAG: glycosyltransferase [Desulfatiglandaceae bacterium]
MNQKSLKADLHVHSKYSRRPSEWILRKIGCSESYTEPLSLYSLAKANGMDLVTITDHNSLAGSLDIAHLNDTFISEEITTYFPDDGCKLHVLAYDITERHHEEIIRLRENVFDLVRYLNRKGIIHALAHPLYPVNDKLTLGHLEKALVLFKNFEINGSRDHFQNDILRQILQDLTKEKLEQLSNKYDLEPFHPRPWEKALISGSDDHASLNIGGCFTEVEGALCLRDFLKGIRQNRLKVGGKASNPKAMAHTIYSVAYQFYKSRFSLERYLHKDLTLHFLDHALVPFPEEAGLLDRFRNALRQRRKSTASASKQTNMIQFLQKEGREIILSDETMHALINQCEGKPWKNERIWFHFLNQVSERILHRFADSFLESLRGGNLFDVFHVLGSAGSLYTMLAPYFVAFTLFTKDRNFCRQCLDIIGDGQRPPKTEELKIAHFTDTYYDVNGVAKTLQMQTEMALRNHKMQEIITCGPEQQRPQVINFSPIGTFELPEYPDIKLYYPPFLRMLEYCYTENFTQIHSATPGPIGLAALAIARILKLPIFGTYHTALPQYASFLTEDSAMEELMWKFSIWYYNQMDVVYVPSMATGRELEEKGIRKEKIVFYPRGIDLDHFHPSKRNGFFRNRFGLDTEELKLLYVGRVSKEKNMPFLVEAFKQLAVQRSDIRLIVVGDGPYLAEMQAVLSGLPATFTGFLSGEGLAQAYASSDLFVFPSTTDTFGNVVLEAQASGLPVIVTDEGGPKENLVPDRTGFVVPARTDLFIQAVLKLADHPALLADMKRHAREYMESRSFESAYIQLWDSYQEHALAVKGR